MLCIEALWLIQTNIDGGSRDRETTEDAVMACCSEPFFAEITVTVEVIPRMARRKSFSAEGEFTESQITMSIILNLP